ncbi:MAG: SPFH domain-containing protein [Nocardioides sp.]
MSTAELDVQLPKPTVTERIAFGLAGLPMVIGLSATVLGGLALLLRPVFQVGSDDAATRAFGSGEVTLMTLGGILALASLLLVAGLTTVAPGEARVLQLFGKYVGTVRAQGLWWVNPLTSRRKISTRIRNHQTETLKVNDLRGNPVQIAAVVVWQVADTAQATFEVDDFVEFVDIQADSALRHVASRYPYDDHGDGTPSLLENAEHVTAQLAEEIGIRVAAAGVHVVEARLTRLAYAPEIAQAMLRRQQAGAVVAARQQIVEGAVGMVEQALARLTEHEVVELDEERKATMVSNLLVVLCGDRDAQPVVNAGSLY